MVALRILGTTATRAPCTLFRTGVGSLAPVHVSNTSLRGNDMVATDVCGRPVQASRKYFRTFAGISFLIAMLGGPASLNAAAAEGERRYCFSDVCVDDPTSVLGSVALGSLDKMADPQHAKESLARLEAALPALGRGARATVASYTDADGALLLDRRTLPIVLQIDRICAPMGRFVSMFSSESGHPTAIEFQTIASDGAVRLGVTRIARSFDVMPGSGEERALIADLSEKYGFRVDESAAKRLPSHGGSEVTASFIRQSVGFQLSFSREPLSATAAEFNAQASCGPARRIKID